MRAILRENYIAVREMAVPNQYPIISLPFLSAISAQRLLQPPSLTENDWDLTFDAEFISKKEYELTSKEGDTLFYDLIIKKESKKMSTKTICGCICYSDRAIAGHSERCYCLSKCTCKCGEEKKMKDGCCDGKKVSKIVLAGFKPGEYQLRYITSFSNIRDHEGNTEYLLDKADINRTLYKSMFLLYFDIDLKIIDTKNICFEEVAVKPELKATLC